MAALIPFTAYFRVVPIRGKRRFEYIRALQKMANLTYAELQDNAPTTIVLPVPGGGQYESSGQFSGIAYGTAIRPQIGNNPSLLMIEAFYAAADSDPSDQPNPDVNLIYNNAVLTGIRGRQPWLGAAGSPVAAVENEVVALKTILETAISAVVDEWGHSPTLFRLSYKGTIWGDGGLTFPR